MKSVSSKIKVLLLMILALSTWAESISAQSAISKHSNTAPPQPFVFKNLENEKVPLFVFSYVDPWRNVYGSDSPQFILYEDGTVIFVVCREKDNPYSCYYRMSKLSAAQRAETMNELNPDAFYSFASRYYPDDSITVSDLTSRVLMMRKPDASYKSVQTYGALSGDEKGYVAKDVPQALKNLVELVTTYRRDDVIDFDFEFEEIVIRPFDDDKSSRDLKWSKELPDLNDIRTIKHAKYGRYSLFLSRSQNKNFQKIWWRFVKSNYSDSVAFLINGKKWKIERRLPFPSEATWLGDFRK